MNPEMIFVFAAGNDGLDNKLHPIAPANIKEKILLLLLLLSKTVDLLHSQTIVEL